MPENNSDQLLRILESVHTIALVGASEKTHRASHDVMMFLQEHGYRVIPVNPRLAGTGLLGETVYDTVSSIPEPVDMADLFLAPHRVAPVVEQAIEKGVGVVWMQLGVIHQEAAARAEAAGIKVVMDHCPKQEILGNTG